MKKLLKAFGILIFLVLIIGAGAYIYVNAAYPKVSEVPKLSVPSDSATVARGQYLANHVSLCIDCHSTRDWTIYTAPLVKGTEGKGGEKFLREYGFPGNFYSRNITPYGLKDWTDGEIYRTITEGVDRNKRAFFPVMPYPHFASMDPEDVQAIIAYIRTLPEIKNDVQPSEPDFPFSLIIRTIPHKATPTKRPDPSQVIDYGAYMVNIAACFDCHTQFDKGKYNEAMAFAGGRSFPMPAGIVTSANLTPDEETGIGSWSQEAFIARFKSYADESKLQKVDPQKDMMTIMPWHMYGGMDSSDLAAIYTYLHQLKPIKNEVVKWKAKS